MQDNLSVNVNDQHDFTISQNEMDTLDVLALDETKFHLLKDHKSFITKILKSDFHQNLKCNLPSLQPTGSIHFPYGQHQEMH